MAVWVLTGLLGVHVYSPASSRLTVLMTRVLVWVTTEMVILESAVMVEPPLAHWTLICVPAVQAQVRVTFPPSTVTEGTVKVTPATASAKKKYGESERIYFIKEIQNHKR